MIKGESSLMDSSEKSYSLPPLKNGKDEMISLETFRKMERLARRERSGKRKKNAKSKVEHRSDLLDTITMKKHLKIAFGAMEIEDGVGGEYLRSVQSAQENGSIPQSKIPDKYFVFSKAPLQQQLMHDLAEKDDVLYNDQHRQWEKLIFPSSKPSRRVEIYLLAKAIDDMLLKLKENKAIPRNDDQYYEMTMQNLASTFSVHMTALNEITRQVYVNCVERGVVLQKIQEYFENFFDVVTGIVGEERKNALDARGLIQEYEKLTNNLAIEKQQISGEMERLLKDKHFLFKEREILKRKVLGTEGSSMKYDLILKLLKNNRTREKILKGIRKRTDQPIEFGPDTPEEEDVGSNFEKDEFFDEFKRKHKIGNKKLIKTPAKSQFDDSLLQEVEMKNVTIQNLTHRHRETAKLIKLAYGTLEKTIKHLNRTISLAKVVTGLRIEDPDFSEFLHATEYDLAIFRRCIFIINDSMVTVNEVLSQQAEIIEKRNYIHVIFSHEMRTDRFGETGPYIKCQMATKGDLDSQAKTNYISKLESDAMNIKKSHAMLKDENKKLKQRCEELALEMDQRETQYSEEREEINKLKDQYEEEMEKKTMDYVTMRNYFEKRIEELKESIRRQKEDSENIIQDQEESLLKKMSDREAELSNQANEPIKIILNLNVNEKKDPLAEILSSEDLDAEERVQQIEECIAEQEDYLQNLYATLRREKRKHGMNTTRKVPEPYHDTHSDVLFIPEKDKLDVMDLDMRDYTKDDAANLKRSSEVGVQTFETSQESPTQETPSVPAKFKNSRLRAIAAKYQSIELRPKSLLWLLRLCTVTYRSKHDSNQTDVTLPNFIFEYLRSRYGTSEMVDEYSGAIIATVEKYQDQDLRVTSFGHMLREEWPISLVNHFVDLWNLVDQCKFGPEYNKKAGDEGSEPAVLSKVRIMYILSKLKDKYDSELLKVIAKKVCEYTRLVDRDMYIEAMHRSGFKTDGPESFNLKANWGVDEREAREIISFAQFLTIFTQEIANE